MCNDGLSKNRGKVDAGLFYIYINKELSNKIFFTERNTEEGKQCNKNIYKLIKKNTMRLQHEHSIQNLPRQLANAKAFAEAYLHFIVFALAIKMPRQLNS